MLSVYRPSWSISPAQPPGGRGARAAGTVVVGARDPVAPFLPLEPALRPHRPEADPVFKHLGPREAQLQRRAAPPDARRDLRSGPVSPAPPRPFRKKCSSGSEEQRTLRLPVSPRPGPTDPDRVAHAHDLAPDR